MDAVSLRVAVTAFAAAVGLVLAGVVPALAQPTAGPGRPTVQVHGIRSAANGPVAPCFAASFPDCTSTDPQATFSLGSTGDTSGCSFAGSVDWGDGQSTSQDFSGGPDGSLLVTFSHTYKRTGSYTINWSAELTSGTTCNSNSGSLGFTFAQAPTAKEQGAEDNPSEKPANCSDLAPVNCATGVFWHQFTDFQVPGPGLPLEFTRTYSSSRAGTSGPLGFGWTDSYAMSLAVAASGAVTVTQEDGSQVSFQPDGHGGFTTQARVLATLSKTSSGFTFVRDADQTRYGFSAAGRLTSEKDLDGYTTKLAYGSAGHLASVTDATGRKLTLTYSGSHLVKLTDPARRAWTYGYDTRGDLTSAKDPLGRKWSFTYSPGHRLLTMRDPRGGVTTTKYNAKGQVTAQTDPDHGKTTWSFTGNAASPTGGITTMTDRDSRVTSFTFASLELVSVTHAAGTASAATTSYTYDPATLGITSVTNPDGDVTTSTYDSQGNLLSTTDPLGRTTTYIYNPLNEVLTRTSPLGQVTTSTYDGKGNLLSTTDPLGGATAYAYGNAARPGEVTSVTNPDGDVITYSYDAHGDISARHVVLSAHVFNTTGYAYDADSERTCVAAPDATKAGTTCPGAGSEPRKGTAGTTYDADGEVTSVTTATGHVTRYAYNGDGDLSKITNASGQVTTYAYNGNDQQTKVTRPGGVTQVSAYDPNGRLTSKTDSAGHVTRYSYDALGQVVKTTNPLGLVSTDSYDLAGLLLTTTDPAGRVTTYTYDAAGERAGVSYSDGKTPDVGFAYNGDGLRSSMTDGTGTTFYSYDADLRLTSVTNGAGQTVSYGYDPAGQLMTLTYPSGQQVTRAYNPAGELTAVTDWLGHKTTFSYDPTGNLTGENFPNAVKSALGYNGDGALTSISDTKAATTLAGFRYTRDKLSRIMAVAQRGAFQGTEHFSYTTLSQLSSDAAGTYSYDKNGDVTRLAGGAVQAYNAAGELTSVTAKKAKTSYAYDKNGNLTSIKPTGHKAAALTYDQANRLIGFGGTAAYAYNGDGLRMAKKVGATTTTFSYDQSGAVPLVLTAGAVSYVYGPSGQPIEQVTGSTPTYLLLDQQGSVRLLTNGTGTVVGTYTYGSYGGVTRHTGTATCALGYDGEFTDAESGLVYLQARYYDPATAGFISVDPAVSLTLTPYGYASGNPVNAGDPTGLVTWWNPSTYTKDTWGAIGKTAAYVGIGASLVLICVATACIGEIAAIGGATTLTETLTAAEITGNIASATSAISSVVGGVAGVGALYQSCFGAGSTGGCLSSAGGVGLDALLELAGTKVPEGLLKDLYDIGSGLLSRGYDLLTDTDKPEQPQINC